MIGLRFSTDPSLFAGGQRRSVHPLPPDLSGVGSPPLDFQGLTGRGYLLVEYRGGCGGDVW